MATQNSNQRRGIKFCELISLTLKSDGHVGVTQKPGAGLPLSVRILDDQHSDIRGIEGWVLNTRAESVSRDLSGACDQAEADAQADGMPYSATVFSRPQRRAEESYVVMTLASFSAFIRDTASAAKP